LIGLCCFKAPGLQEQAVAFTERETQRTTKLFSPAPQINPVS